MMVMKCSLQDACAGEIVFTFSYHGNTNMVCDDGCHGNIVLDIVCRYTPGPTPEAEQWLLVDTMNGLEWEKLAKGRSFVYFPGLDSPGGDYLFVHGGVAQVMEACRQAYRCVGQ